VGRKLLVMSLLPLVVALSAGSVLVRDRLRILTGAQLELAGLACIVEVNRMLQAAAAPETSLVSRQATAVLMQVPQCAEAVGGALRQAVERLTKDPAQQKPDAQGRATLAALRAEVLRQGQLVVSQLAFQSGLGDNPALADGRYVVPIMVERLPELLVLAQRVSELLLSTAAVPREPVEDWRNRYFMLEGQLVGQARLMELDGQHAKARVLDEPVLGALAVQAQVLAAVEAFSREARALALAPNAPGAEALKPLLSTHQALLVQIDEYGSRLTAPLRGLLQKRIDGRRQKLMLQLGGGGLLLLGALAYAWAAARQILRPLQHMSDVARAVRRGNDISRRMEWDSRDEFGTVAHAFNHVLSRLGSHHQEQQQLNATLSALQARQRLADITPLPIIVTALPTHELLHANGPGLAWIGQRQSDPLSAGLEPAVRAQLQRLLAERGQVDELEVRWHGGAHTGWGVLSARRLAYEGRDAVLTVFTPVDQVKRGEQGLSLWLHVFEAATEGIAICDASRHVVSLNPALCRLTACRTDMVVGRGLEQLLSEDMGRDFIERLWRVIETQGRWQGEVWLHRPDGKTVPAWLSATVVSEGEATGTPRRYTIFSALDISERKAQEQRIRYLAYHDALTGLPNRVLFVERLRAMVQRARQGEQQVAVLCIDPDRFKNVNDTLGRPAGDALLRAVAQRLLETVRGGDVVCRLGGAELGVALGGIRDGEEALRLVEQRFLPQLRHPHVVGGSEVRLGCSVGVALCPPEEDVDEAMRRADAAMMQAKGRGGDAACLFTAELHERAHRRMLVEAQLRQALERNEFTLHYQPRVAAHDGSLSGLAALLRWHSARLGPVGPAEFVSVAESSRLIVPLGAWVIDEVCRQQAQWKAQGLAPVPVTINLSPVQLREPGLASALQAALERHGVAPKLLELELGESAVMEDVEFMLQQLLALKRLGVELAIDNFGTGYSSVPHLHRFPIDALKIDRTVVAELALDPTHLAVPRAIVGMAHTLGLRVVAEGVEDESTAMALRGVACDELQGYHYAQPLPPHDLEAWVEQQQASQAARTEAAKPKLQLLSKNDAAEGQRAFRTEGARSG